MPFDQKYMSLALGLARKGAGRVSPNPMVGCVIVKNKKIIATGYHKKFGGPHAEVEALKKIKMKAKGTTLYVTLEPCHHFGKTPPCVDAVIGSGVKRVVVAMRDPNPKTHGKSIKKLRAAGIAVSVGVCEEKARELNKFFIKYITTKKPYVICKVAQSLDGMITPKKGKRGWITGQKAREYVQKLRSQVDAVLVGRRTIEIDDPLLNVRWPRSSRHDNQPMRVILDSQLRLKTNQKIFHSPGGKVILVTRFGPNHPRVKHFLSWFAKRGLSSRVQVLCTAPKTTKKLDLRLVMQRLHALGVASVLIEGGAKVFESFFATHLVDEWQFIVAPKFVGNKGLMALRVASYKKFTCRSMVMLGPDMLLHAVKS